MMLLACGEVKRGAGVDANGQSGAFMPAPTPPPAPAKTQLTVGDRILHDSQPAAVAHDTRSPDRYFFGVIGDNDDTQFRFHMRLSAADLQHGVVRGTLAPLMDVSDQDETGRTRIGYVGVYTKSDGVTTQPLVGSFEVTLSAGRIVGWVKADPVNGVDASASFEAELEAVCIVPTTSPANPSSGSIPDPGSNPGTTMKEDRSLLSPGCEHLRAFAQP